MYGKLSEIDKFVRANYYGETNDDTLYDTIASGYILGLGDRYATYYTAKAFTELQDMQNGKIMGIGVDVIKDTSGAARITKVYAGSPADRWVWRWTASSQPLTGWRSRASPGTM